MEREIANVAAASAMRGFRYMAFPPIVFDPPAVELALPEWLMEPASIETPMETSPPDLTASVPEPRPPDPPAARPMLDPPAALAPVPPRASLAPPMPTPAAAVPTTERRFALLSEVSAELRRPPR